MANSVLVSESAAAIPARSGGASPTITSVAIVDTGASPSDRMTLRIRRPTDRAIAQSASGPRSRQPQRRTQIDISFNAVGFGETGEFRWWTCRSRTSSFPITAFSKTVFLTGRVAARRMPTAGSGVVFVLNAPAGNDAMGGGFPTACAAIQTIARTLAGEVGLHGVRVLCLQPNAIPESESLRRSVAQYAGASGVDVDVALRSIANATLLPAAEAGRCCHDRRVHGFGSGSVMTGTVVKLNCGSRVD